MTPTPRTAIIRTRQSGFPRRPAVYAFGSRSRGDGRPASDLDLAVLAEECAEPVVLWEVVFAPLAQGGRAEPALAGAFECRVGFRKTAGRDDQSLQLPIAVSVTEKHLDEFLQFARTLRQRDPAR